MINRSHLWRDRRKIGRCCRPVICQDQLPALEAQVIRGTTKAERRPNFKSHILSNNNSKAVIINRKRRLERTRNKIKVRHLSMELVSSRQMVDKQSLLTLTRIIWQARAETITSWTVNLRLDIVSHQRKNRFRHRSKAVQLVLVPLLRWVKERSRPRRNLLASLPLHNRHKHQILWRWLSLSQKQLRWYKLRRRAQIAELHLLTSKKHTFN